MPTKWGSAYPFKTDLIPYIIYAAGLEAMVPARRYLPEFPGELLKKHTIKTN